MSFRSWRERKLLSQERVAEMSGLSLRTVQRLDAGHRVSYASLRALATAFEIDVDQLERELYAVKKSTDEFVEIPRWVRLMSGAHWFGGPGLSRKNVLFLEAFCMACTVLALAVAFFGPDHGKLVLTRIALLPLAGCYLTALTIRMIDRYKLWPGAENAFPVKPRTWRTITAEYSFMIGTGVLGVVLILWMAN